MYNKNYFAISFFIFLLFVLTPLWLFAQSESAVNNNVLKVKRTIDFIVTGNGSSENWKNTDWNILPQHNSKTLKNEGWNISPQHSISRDLQYKTSFKILY